MGMFLEKIQIFEELLGPISRKTIRMRLNKVLDSKNNFFNVSMYDVPKSLFPLPMEKKYYTTTFFENNNYF